MKKEIDVPTDGVVTLRINEELKSAVNISEDDTVSLTVTKGERVADLEEFNE